MNRQLFFDLIPAMPQEERIKVQWAYDIAKKWHDGQKRDTGERYFEHVRAVASVLVDHGYTEADYIVLAILHDVLEDTDIPLTMLERLFGPLVTREILTVSKSYPLEDPLTGFITRSPKRQVKEYFESIARGGKRPALAKCADRIHNLSDLVHPPEGSRWTPEKRLAQVAETREWILPLADMYDARMAFKLRALCDLIEANVELLRAQRAATPPPHANPPSSRTPS